MKCPIPESYWVVPGKLLAGEYPIHLQPARSRAKLKSILQAGITCFIDLTSPADGMHSYADLLAELSGGRAFRRSFPIVDLEVPTSAEEMRRILDCIDLELSGGQRVMVHCWGGIGRTGTVVGCWLARHHPGQDALALLQARWLHCSKSSYRSSPETKRQCEFVRAWKE